MAPRTYIPGLRVALALLIRYITRYQDRLKGHMSAEAYNCLIATLNAAIECLAAVPAPDVGE
jgi:hypothetical protein